MESFAASVAAGTTECKQLGQLQLIRHGTVAQPEAMWLMNTAKQAEGLITAEYYIIHRY